MAIREITKLSVGLPKVMNFKEGTMETGIDKAVVQHAYLDFDGFKGDDVADKKHHGGADRAVCVYPREHYDYWEETFGSALPAAPFGENITVTHMTEKEVCIGDIYRIGETVIQVTQGRMPCVTINKQTKNNELLKQMIETGYTGYLCRVIEPGGITSGTEVELVERGPGEVTVFESHIAYYHDQKNIELIRKVISVDVLADRWKSRLTERLNRLTGE